ncbi:hypothetical protein K504DRAFT_229000 [Pleomassaria siparia CBS 279.74]|uniref:Uncharacterized protein n=1 Tax=Pleomassaria siparia CBS 279.74 TaxID=1314801 RepID=A0A6G1KFT2_9PLEO|nr:hypothetical protein K504DRAFT_229000 [Pleomassaria siparia CBS 279.74]
MMMIITAKTLNTDAQKHFRPHCRRLLDVKRILVTLWPKLLKFCLHPAAVAAFFLFLFSVHLASRLVSLCGCWPSCGHFGPCWLFSFLFGSLDRSLAPCLQCLCDLRVRLEFAIHRRSQGMQAPHPLTASDSTDTCHR